MRTIFVIGGIGSGKSSVVHRFAELGAATLDLDVVGHEALREGGVRAALVGAFGEGILDAAGGIDRKALAAAAFATPEGAAALTGLTSPAILARLASWLAEQAEQGTAFAVVEVSAFDGPDGLYGGLCDTLVAVCAPLDLRLERAFSKGFAETDVRARLAAQPSDEQRQAWADFTIENDGSRDDLQTRAEAVWAIITGEGKVVPGVSGDV